MPIEGALKECCCKKDIESNHTLQTDNLCPVCKKEGNKVRNITVGAKSVKDIITLTGAMKNSQCQKNNPLGKCCHQIIDRVLNLYYNETKKQRNKETKKYVLFYYLMHIIKEEATMGHIAIRSESKMERKIISVSVKRQVTIPQKYFEALGFDNEAECILQEGGILLRPVRDTSSGEFSEQILADLIAQGFSGQELLEKFKEQRKKVRPAVKKLIEEADAMAKSSEGKVSLDEIFGTEEQ